MPISTPNQPSHSVNLSARSSKRRVSAMRSRSFSRSESAIAASVSLSAGPVLERPAW
jgi:hypothetical protein